MDSLYTLTVDDVKKALIENDVPEALLENPGFINYIKDVTQALIIDSLPDLIEDARRDILQQ